MIATVAPSCSNSRYSTKQSRKKSSIQSSVFLPEIESEISDFCFRESNYEKTSIKLVPNEYSPVLEKTIISKFHEKRQATYLVIKRYIHSGIVIGSALALGFTIWYANNQKRELCPAHQHYFAIQKKCCMLLVGRHDKKLHRNSTFTFWT